MKAKLTRNNHLKHLNSMMPLILVFYAIQCIVISNVLEEVSIGSYALGLGVALCGFLTWIFHYNTYHKVILTKDKIEVEYSLFGKKEILYSEIQDIITVDETTDFAHLSIITEKGNHTFLFVDYPLEIKKLILSIKDSPENFTLAA